METKTLKQMEPGQTLMLAREIMERTSTSQVYEKVDDATVRHHDSGATMTLPPEELVVPFNPANTAPV